MVEEIIDWLAGGCEDDIESIDKRIDEEMAAIRRIEEEERLNAYDTDIEENIINAYNEYSRMKGI